MSELITVPNFQFSQGDIFEGAEYPVTVCYYESGNDKILIELQQEGRHINFSSLAELKQLVKEVAKHLPEATKKLRGGDLKNKK